MSMNTKSWIFDFTERADFGASNHVWIQTLLSPKIQVKIVLT